MMSTVTVQEAISSYREVTVTDRRDFYRDRFRELRMEATRNYASLSLVGLFPKFALESALVIGAALLTMSQLMASSLVEAVGTLALFLAAGSRVMPSLLRLQTAATGIRSCGGAAAFTFDLAAKLRTTGRPKTSCLDAAQVQELIRAGHPDLVPTIEVQNVAVTYPAGSKPALSDISLAVGAGRSLALVGPTGAGKSTLADVILGVLEPDKGKVLIGGVAPTEAVTRWPGGIAYVPQTVALTNGSVRDNVALGVPRNVIDDDLVWHSLNRAHIADFLRDSRDGLDTAIGEHGVRLSGGQRQRLGIARALYSSPRVLVLDEATSALDAETEDAIADTLRSLEGGVTTITIAHRLATVRDADLIVYLESGQVLASGDFAAVRARVPRFDRQARLLGL